MLACHVAGEGVRRFRDTTTDSHGGIFQNADTQFPTLSVSSAPLGMTKPGTGRENQPGLSWWLA